MGGHSNLTTRVLKDVPRISAALLASAFIWTTPVLAATHKHHPRRPVRIVSCKPGQARLVVGKRTICTKDSLPNTTSTPPVAQAAIVLGFDLSHLPDRHGRHAKSFSALARRAGPHTMQRIEQTVASGIARAEALELAEALGRPTAQAQQAPLASAATTEKCRGADELARMKKEYDDASPAEKAEADKTIADAQSAASTKSGDIDASLDLLSGAAKFGINIKEKGIRIEIGLRMCGDKNSLEIDSCPTAQGKLKGHDVNELAAFIKVTEGSKLLTIQDFKLTGETTIEAETGDDAKLDHFDIKHLYRSLATVGGAKQGYGPITIDTTYIGEARIDMRSSGGSLPPAVVDVMASGSGIEAGSRIAEEIKIAHDAQTEADKVFAAEVKLATDKLRAHEAAWMEANKCAQMKFEPASETLKLNKGQSGTFKSTIEANAGGVPPAATWTLSAQQNASFTPTGGSANPLSTSYNVTNAGKGLVVSTVVKATSKAGVAEGTWKQKTTQALKTISGTFTGRIEYLGSLMEWTGTATFERKDVPGTDPEVASVFQLTSGQAEVTASGAFVGADCTQSGKATIALQPLGLWTLEQKNESFKYEIIAAWEPTELVPVTLSNCSPASLDGTQEELVMQAPAIQSGHVDTSGDPSKAAAAIEQSSPDGLTFEGSASEESLEENYSWNWSFKGST
jgi:hypothetical protein